MSKNCHIKNIVFAALFCIATVCTVAAADSEQKVSASQTLPAPPLPAVSASENAVSLEKAAIDFGAGLFWDPASGRIILEKNGHFLQFRVGDRLALFDFKTLQIIDAPFIGTNGEVKLTASSTAAIQKYLDSRPPDPVYKVGAVLIDPGHGGRDSGAVGVHTINGKTIRCVEKDVVLDVSKQLYGLLKKAYPGKKIVLTRTGDTYPSLEDRVEIANNLALAPNEAVVYVSVHANSSFNKKASGFEVWYLSQDYRRKLISEEETESKEIAGILNAMMEEEFTTESILIAKFIMDEMNRQIGTQSVSRGIKEESWFVVRNVHMPSVLVELGFVSNPAEAQLLLSPSYLQKCALGIYNGLETFINYFENSKGFTSAE